MTAVTTEHIAPERFEADILRNPVNRALCARLPALGLSETCLVAGALFQTVWNLQCGRAPGDGIDDYDVFYFDRDDVSPEAEARARERAGALVADLGITLDLCNQARVHHWYQEHFGHPTAARRSSEDSVGRFLVRCTCVGYALLPSRAPRLVAPFGLEEMYAGILRRNTPTAEAELFDRQVARYRARWPHLVAADA